jgi:hypothetical protein
MRRKIATKLDMRSLREFNPGIHFGLSFEFGQIVWVLQLIPEKVTGKN